MTAIPFTHEHYPIARQWWISHGWAPPPVQALPALGYIVEGHALAFLYHDPTTTLGLMEYILANPANSPLQSARAIAAVVAALTDHARSLGKTHLLTTCRQASLAKFLANVSDFIPTDTQMLHLIKPL